MNKLVSIIVTIYNVEQFLDRCIDSVVKQTYKNLEIILVNDGSTDSSLEICKRWKNKDKRIILVNKKNGGLSDARNSGIDKSNGEFLYFLDSDDFIENNTIELMMKKMAEHNSEIVISNRYHYYDNGKKIIKFKMEKNDLILDTETSLFELNNFKYYDMSACSKLFKKDLFEQIRFPIKKLCEDFYVMYKILEKSKTIIYISTPLYYYYQREGSISKNKNMNIDFVIAAKEQMEYLEEKYPKLKNCVRSTYASANMTVYNQVLRAGGKVDRDKRKQLQREVKKYIKYVLKNENLILIKKIQSVLFIFNIHIYNMLFMLFY